MGGKPRLIVIRGNSSSGKSAVAAAIRERHGQHNLAIVSQDLLRRVVLREHDVPAGANIALIDMTARFAITRGFHVIVEGILRTDHYGDMLTRLIGDYAESARAYFLDVPFEETLRRHATKPQADEYGEEEMRGWYRGLDLLPDGVEQVIPAESSLEDTVRKVMTNSGLSQVQRDANLSSFSSVQGRLAAFPWRPECSAADERPSPVCFTNAKVRVPHGANHPVNELGEDCFAADG